MSVEAFGCESQGHDIFASINGFLYGLWRRFDVEICLQGLPAEGVGGLKEDDVEGEGVIDGEVLDEGGFDAGGVLVAEVFGASLLQGQLAGASEDRRANEAADEEDGEGYVVAFFHFPSRWLVRASTSW